MAQVRYAIPNRGEQQLEKMEPDLSHMPWRKHMIVLTLPLMVEYPNRELARGKSKRKNFYCW